MATIVVLKLRYYKIRCVCIQSVTTIYAPLPETYKLRYVISGVSLANGCDDTFYYTEALL